MNIEEFQREWVDKYRPDNLDDYVLNDDIKQYFKDMIQKKAVLNCSLCGIAGSGKTTLARILAKQANADVLFVKCATEGTVDIVRSKIEPFCNAMTFDGKLKIVILDEVDSASTGGGNSFLMALRTLIEASQNDTRFICTCNFVNKVIPALLSRCPIIPLKFDKKDLAIHLKKILDTEGIGYDRESLKAFLEESFQYYPDCRRIVNYLQFCSNSGKLTVNLNGGISNKDNDLVKQIVNKARQSEKIMDIRSFYLQNKSKIDDYKVLAGEIYDYCIDNGILTDPKIIVKASDIIYQMNLVINPEIQFFALVCLVVESM